MVLHPVHVGVPGHRGAIEGSEVVVSIDGTDEAVHPVPLPTQVVVFMASLEPGQTPPLNGLRLQIIMFK